MPSASLPNLDLNLPVGKKDVSIHSAYRVSARRYRPKTFGELYGQEALVQTLSNGIETARLPHAFIFTGIRGVGKTTTARILARSLNCVGVDGKGQETITPCGVCDHCKAIDEDRHLDVIEMDAASRTGVDDVREVIEAARYKAVSARYKIYIIDEVHMLSKSAFNALLKTLEEPPAHVKFIFATTEIKKVPQTVLSRCMRFDLKRIDTEKLMSLFQSVCEKENVTINQQALALIARTADGSARDGLSILDQAITISQGKITLASVQEMLGVVDKTLLLEVYKDLAQGNAPTSLQKFESMYEKGGDALSFLKDLLDLTHWLTVLKVCPSMANDPTISQEEKDQAQDLIKSLSIPVLTRFWQALLKGSEEARNAPSIYQATRMILVRLAYMSLLPTPEEIAIFLSKNESSSVKAPLTSPLASPVQDNSPHSPQPERDKVTIGAEPSETESKAVISLPQSFEDMVTLFQTHNEPLLYSYLSHDARLVRYAPGEILLNLTPHAPRDLTTQVAKCLKEWTGHSWHLTVTTSEEGEPTLLEKQRHQETKRREEIAQEPLVKAALEMFPGATIQSIRENS